MATTFRAMVYLDNKKQDGTYNVKIRVTHNRKSLKVSTNYFATASDLTRNTLNIKSQDIIDATDDLIRRWRNIVNKLGTAADNMDVKQVVDYIKDIELNGDVFKLDFIKYGREVADAKNKGNAGVYRTSLNALDRYAKGRILDISQITAKFLLDFETFLVNEPAMTYNRKEGVIGTQKTKANGRAVSLYLSNIRHIHNQAKKDYNDEDNGIIRIPQSPFIKYEIRKIPKVRKKAITPKLIQQIINLPDIDRSDGSIVDFSRRDLARDCFLLSFGLAGMNAIDIYECSFQNLKDRKKVIIYNRTKTKSRRDDEAEMQIRVEAYIAPLVKKYTDPTGERLFVFHKHYSTMESFNSALRQGLIQVKDAIKTGETFTFYSARHSWATIGRSKALKLDKYTIHEGLNHVDPEMKVTDIYIDRDWSTIWEANAKILGLFDWSLNMF